MALYLDNAATTQPLLSADFVNRYMSLLWMNPSSSYSGHITGMIDQVKERILHTLHSRAGKVYFTSGSSESNTWAIIRVCEDMKKNGKGNHIITSCIEHKSVLETCKYLEHNGFKITYLPVDSNGLVRIEDLKAAITPETVLVSVMAVNNEIGTIEPIEDIGKICNAKGIAFHVDATQAFAKIPINVDECRINLLSASAHKFRGIKGVGFLYNNPCGKYELTPYIFGGHQEDGMRAGTENTFGICSLYYALQHSNDKTLDEIDAVAECRDEILKEIAENIPNVSLNGASAEYRTVDNINICIKDVDAQQLQTYLADHYNIYVSVGSACNSYVSEPSYVLKAIGLTDDEAKSSIRITLGEALTTEECKYLCDSLKSSVKLLRTLQ